MSDSPNGVRFEKRDINPRSGFWFGFWILAGMVVVAFLVKPLYNLLSKRETAAQAPAAYVLATEPGALEPSGPRLQVKPELDIEAFRAQEDAILESYAWVDKERGVVRIPVAEAMRLVAERGLPAFSPLEDNGEGEEENTP
jgi:predicted ATP-grasp superfamily ATP-dependent carboligase